MGLLTKLAAWVVTPIGTTVAAVLVLFGAWQVDRYGQRQKGAETALKQVQQKTEAINAKARAARDAAGGAGAVDRMRSHWCVDCR